MINLTFITVSKYQHNIPAVLVSIKEQYISNLIWYIIFDFDEKSLDPIIKNELDKESSWIKYRFMPDSRNSIGGGNFGKDLLIKEINNGWIYQIDDDNILYPNFIKKFLDLLNNHPESNIFCFWQHNRYRPKTKNDLRVGIVDTAMYIFNKYICENINYPIEYGGDGLFLENMLKNPEAKLWIEQQTMCYYNYIRENPMNELCNIAKKHGTDKFHKHKYCEKYETILNQYKNKNDISLLEIGVLGGSSIKMWEEWLPNAKIYGVDNWISTNTPFVYSSERVKIINANSKNIDVCKYLDYQSFDIIVDDGDHHPYAQLTTMWNLWPLLKKDGLYIIEDVQSIDDYKKHWDLIPNIKIIDCRQISGEWDSVLLIAEKR